WQIFDDDGNGNGSSTNKEFSDAFFSEENEKLAIAFEHSSDLQNDEKQRIALGENIMRLMRKLDTIQ
ncbi:hypothetical protein S83_021183, partial [Arachis hypogaea]